MTLRGKAAIVGLAELPSVRTHPGRTAASLMAEASAMAIEDAGLRKDQIDGLITHNQAALDGIRLAEYMRIRPKFCEAVTTHGASGAYAVELAAMVIDAGIANYVLCTLGGTTDRELGGNRIGRPGSSGPPPGTAGEWEAPFGPVVANNGHYGLLKQRHMYQYGTTDRQFAKMAVNQRFNALNNPNALFQGKPITVEDVLASRFTNDPIHLLECVMPCIGAAAVIVASAERARLMPHPPVYLLGAGGSPTTHEALWQREDDITVTAVAQSAPIAYRMAGYGPKDMQFAQMYD